MTRIIRSGTARCTYCALEQADHDLLFEQWASGQLSGEEVAGRFGLGPDSWRRHLERHIAGWKALAAEASVIVGGEVEKVRVRILSLANEAADPVDREHLLELGVLTLRAHIIALAERGISADPSAARTAQVLVSEVDKATAALEEIRLEREDREIEAGRLKSKDARVELERLKLELREMFSSDPDIAGRVNDILEGRVPSPEEVSQRQVERSVRHLEGMGYVIVPPPDSVEWGGGVEAPSEPGGEEERPGPGSGPEQEAVPLVGR